MYSQIHTRAVLDCRSEREKNQTRIEADQLLGQIEIITQGKVRLKSHPR